MKERQVFLDAVKIRLAERRREITKSVESHSAEKVADKQVKDVGDEASSLSMEKLTSSLQMTELDEINYQRLRFWLKDREAQFVTLWRDFCACQDWAIKDNHEEYDENDSLLKNPFSCLYAPENIYQLAKEFDLQSGIEVWEPSKHRANQANAFILHMGKRMLEFVDWIDERVRA